MLIYIKKGYVFSAFKNGSNAHSKYLHVACKNCLNSMESNIISVYRILECVQGKLVHCDISTCSNYIYSTDTGNSYVCGSRV